MIALTKITNTEIFAFITVLVFFKKQKRQEKLLKKLATFLKNSKFHG